MNNSYDKMNNFVHNTEQEIEDESCNDLENKSCKYEKKCFCCLEKESKVRCINCDNIYCEKCYELLHNEGNLSDHVYTYLPKNIKIVTFEENKDDNSCESCSDCMYDVDLEDEENYKNNLYLVEENMGTNKIERVPTPASSKLINSDNHRKEEILSKKLMINFIEDSKEWISSKPLTIGNVCNFIIYVLNLIKKQVEKESEQKEMLTSLFEYIVLYDDEVYFDTDENYKLVNFLFEDLSDYIDNLNNISKGKLFRRGCC